jgi:hypothetical protein
MPERIPAAVTIRVPFQAYLASDHITPATGKTIAVTISKNGAAYSNPSGGATNATEIGSGSYYVDLSTTDTGTAGPVFVKGTNADIDNVIAIYDVVNANTGGWAGIPNAIPGAAGGLFIAGTNAATTVTTSFTTTFTGNLSGSVGSVVGAVGSVTGAVGSVTGAVGSVTGNVGGNVTGTVSGVTPATTAGILATALTEGYAADGATPTLTQFMYMIWSFLTEKAGSGTTLTCKKLDGSTTSMTFTLDDATNPTALTRAT